MKSKITAADYWTHPRYGKMIWDALLGWIPQSESGFDIMLEDKMISLQVIAGKMADYSMSRDNPLLYEITRYRNMEGKVLPGPISYDPNWEEEEE